MRMYLGIQPLDKAIIGGNAGMLRIAPRKDLVYELTETTFNGATYIDTGIDLSQYEQYTVCLDAQFGDTGSVQNMVDWMTEKSPYPVWAIDINGSRIRMGTKSPFTIETPATTERRRYVVRCDNGVYTLFSIQDPYGFDFTSTIATGEINHTLYVGAYYNNGSVNRYVHNGSKIWSFQVYSTALSDEECINFYENGVTS